MKRKDSILFYLTRIVLSIACTIMQKSIGLKNVYIDKHLQEPFYIVYTHLMCQHMKASEPWMIKNTLRCLSVRHQ